MADEFLGMSDEEFLKDAPALEESHLEESNQSEESDDVSEPEGEQYVDDVEDSPEGSGDEPSPEVPEEEAEVAPEPSVPVEDLAKVLQPFRANGTEVQARSVDEAIQLMQMGANYTKKMQALQPNLKLLKSLEKEGLLDETKINYLIDLAKGNPAAIAKLVKQSGDDWIQVDEDKEYTPTDHQVSDSALQLEQVLDYIESTPTGSRCLDVVGNHWDEGSKTLLANSPQLIHDINEQMQMGIFDMVMKEVEHVKLMGGLAGKSDFEAYRLVGAKMFQEGRFNAPAPVARTEPKPRDSAREDKRRAAATPSSKKQTASSGDYNPLAMSDEEFLKLNNIRI